MSAIRRLALLSVLFIVGGCARSGPAAVALQGGAGPNQLPGVTAVSLSSTSGDAAAGILACGVRKYAANIQGMGIVASARTLPQFVRLTGREPEIQSDAPVFVVEFTGPLRLPLRGGVGSAAYRDIDNATCAVIDGWPIWYATGSWVDSLGNRGAPEQAPMPDKSLPTPLP
jgi:hypothetical protein